MKSRRCKACNHACHVVVDSKGREVLVAGMVGIVDDAPSPDARPVKVVGIPTRVVLTGYRVMLGSSDRQGWRIHDCGGAP